MAVKLFRGALGTAVGMAAMANTEINMVCPSITPTKGAELLNNGNMETGNPPANWTGVNATLAQVAEERTGGAGSNCLSIARNGTNYFDAYQKGVTSAGNMVEFSAYYKRVDATIVDLMVYNDTGGTVLAATPDINATSWTNKVLIARAIDSNCRAFLRGYSSGANGVKNYYDDVSLKVLDFATCRIFLKSHNSSGTFQCAPTVLIGTRAGLLINYIDDNNFAAMVIDRSGSSDRAKVIKRVSGTYAADVITGTIVYGDTKIAKCVVNGTTYTLYYDGTLIGSGTISDTLGTGVYGYNTYAGNLVGQVITTPATS